MCLAPHSSLALTLRLTRVLVVSHKSIDLSKNIFLYYYYTSRPCLFFVCAANEYVVANVCTACPTGHTCDGDAKTPCAATRRITPCVCLARYL